MEIHELNTFSGTLGSSDYFVTDNGLDTSKISAQDMLAPVNDRIDNIITSPAPSEQEIIDARLGADGTAYSTLGDAVRGPVTDLTNEFVNNNAFDVLDKLTANPSVTMNGITFTRNSNGTYTFSGTATGASFIRFFYSLSSFPDKVKAGGTYYVKFKSEAIKMQVAAYYNNSASGYTWALNDSSGGTITIPSNATGTMFRVFIASGTTVNETIDIPKLLSAPTNSDLAKTADEIKQMTVAELLDIPNVGTNITSGVTFSCNDGVCTVNGTATASVAFLRIFYDETSLPAWAEYGKTYALQFEPYGSAIDGLKLQIALYKSDSSYTWICDSAENTEFTIPNDTSYVGMNIRLVVVGNGTTVHATVEPKILTAPTNAMLWDDIRNSTSAGAVNLISADKYYIRAKYDDNYDSVTAFRYPETEYNYTFNLRDCRLIDKDTLLSDTVSAYQNASLYKDLRDDIPAFVINGVIVGSNHGNPNFIKCTCSHSLTESDVGTVWSDGTYNYTVVQVYPSYIIVGSLDEDGYLIARNPQRLTKSGTTLTISQSESIQLRRSAINRQAEMLNDAGSDISSGGGGAYIKIVEKYDICDQSKMLSWLESNAGNNTNQSYHDDAIPYKLATVNNIFIFNPNSTMTVYGTLTAREAITVNKLYGAMSFDFHSNNAGTDYSYVPKSNEFSAPTAIDYSSNMYITPSSSGVPYRFYQMSSTGAGKGFFLHLIDGLGDCDEETRAMLDPFAWFSDAALKLYLQVRQNVSLTSGKSLSWGYGRGMYKKTSNQTVNACFRLNDAWIVAMDWHNNYSGYASLPKELAGGKVSVIEKTDSVTVSSAFVGNNGIKVSCTGSGYCVLRIE